MRLLSHTHTHAGAHTSLINAVYRIYLLLLTHTQAGAHTTLINAAYRHCCASCSELVGVVKVMELTQPLAGVHVVIIRTEMLGGNMFEVSASHHVI
jgi:hypothetical protein